MMHFFGESLHLGLCIVMQSLIEEVGPLGRRDETCLIKVRFEKTVADLLVNIQLLKFFGDGKRLLGCFFPELDCGLRIADLLRRLHSSLILSPVGRNKRVGFDFFDFRGEGNRSAGSSVSGKDSVRIELR